MGYRIFIDSFDHDTDEPIKLRGEKLDRHVLGTAKKISSFWICETLARAKRVDAWIKSGELVLDNKLGYPWCGVEKFQPRDI